MPVSNAHRAGDAGTRPNVIWIFGDQHPWHALSCNGNPDVNTPNIDRLAAHGVNFTRAVGGFPLCCPCRGSLLTGRYPHAVVPGHEYRMDPAQPTIAHVFNEAGYHTAYFGKWHVDGFAEMLGRAAHHITSPDARGGFQQWVGYDNNNSQWDSWVHGGEGDSAFHYRLPGYETDALTDLLLGYLREHAGGNEPENSPSQPFFAVLSVQPPHNPYVAPAEFMRRHNPQGIHLRSNVPPNPELEAQVRRDLAGAYAMIENLDWNVGRVLATLAECGLAFMTHVVFFSDHGDMHGSHGHLRKTTPYNEALRVPFIIGGERPAGYEGRGVGRVDVPLNHVDVAPTTLGLCGIPVPDWMEGWDYSYYRVRGRRPLAEPDSAYIQQVLPTGHPHTIDKPWRGIVTRDGWKYACFEDVEWLLFDLHADPYELVNLAHYEQHGTKKRELNARLREWVEETEDEFRVPDLAGRQARIAALHDQFRDREVRED